MIVTDEAQPSEPKKKDLQRNPGDSSTGIVRAGISMSARETVGRHGAAGAEFIKGYRGVDNATGQQFSKSLSEIANYKVNADPVEAAKNIKQQAGFSAEIATTSRNNADAIVRGARVRTMRADDLPQYGKNHDVVDRVRLLDGKIIEGTQSQMKFVGDRDALLTKIAREDGKFARYRGIKLELPSEQFEGAKVFCEGRAEALLKNAAAAEQRGKTDVAGKLRREAANYRKLARNVRDSGLTTEEALFYRKHPEIATLLDVCRTSHQAGLQGARYAAIIGGAAAVFRQGWAVAEDEAGWRDASVEVAQETGKAAALGYATAVVGAGVGAVMQQSARAGIRTLAKTSAPALAVNVCVSLGEPIHRYVRGDIGEARLLIEIGQKSAGMLSSAMMAALGQAVVPVPVVGAALGGMAGYTLAWFFYRIALDAAAEATWSRANLERVRAIEAGARTRIAEEQAALEAFIVRELPQLQEETRALFVAVDGTGGSGIDGLIVAIDRYAVLLGKRLQFASQAEFDMFMDSADALRL